MFNVEIGLLLIYIVHCFYEPNFLFEGHSRSFIIPLYTWARVLWSIDTHTAIVTNLLLDPWEYKSAYQRRTNCVLIGQLASHFNNTPQKGQVIASTIKSLDALNKAHLDTICNSGCI